jgi:hypothetical protein
MTQTTPATGSKLTAVKRGTIEDAPRFVFYGSEGTGKSTLCAHAPDPIFLDCEDGTARLDIARYPFHPGRGGHVPASYDDVLAAIKDLTETPHNYKTLVIDTADRLEALLWTWIVRRDSGVGPKGKKLTSIEGYGFGKGYQVALDEWRHLAAQLDRLRMRRNMIIVMLAHAQIKTFKDPQGADYDRYALRVHTLAAGFLKEWADVVGFVQFEQGGDKLDGETRVRGYSTGRRLLKLEHCAAYDAKTRIPMPTEIELTTGNPWSPLGRAVYAGQSMTPEDLIQAIFTETKRIGSPSLSEKVRAACKDERDAATLSRYLNELRRRAPADNTTEEIS